MFLQLTKQVLAELKVNELLWLIEDRGKTEKETEKKREIKGKTQRERERERERM